MLHLSGYLIMSSAKLSISCCFQILLDLFFVASPETNAVYLDFQVSA